MTKIELVKQICCTTGCDAKEVSQIVESLMSTVKQSLSEGENVYLRGFGTFEVKHRAAKVARNISKNTQMVIPAHDIPAFKPSKEFQVQVRK